MALQILFESGADAGTAIVTAAREVRIGRHPNSDIVLLDELVSATHAVVRLGPGGYTIELKGRTSRKNGGVAAQDTTHALAAGDRFTFGGTDVRLSVVSVELRVMTGVFAGRAKALDGSVAIGGAPSADLVLADPTVAAEHVVVEVTPLGFRARALEPAKINGRAFDTRVLAAGDTIQLGRSEVAFVVGSGEVAVAAAPPDHADVTDYTRTILHVRARNVAGALLCVAGDARGRDMPLGDEPLVIGADSSCSFVVNDPQAAPQEVRIARDGGGFVATDLGSRGGLAHNGVRLTGPVRLAAGDLLSFGSHVFFAQLPPGAGPNDTVVDPAPRYVVQGHVLSHRRIEIGRDTESDVVLVEPEASTRHCAIEWESGGFYAIDQWSARGTFVDDKRVTRHRLSGASTLRCGDEPFRVTVSGLVCTIERVDRVRAQANLMRSLLTETTTGERRGPRNAPAWKGTSDLARDGVLRPAAILAIGAAVALCALVALAAGGTLTNHPLSAAHASQGASCRNCHTAGDRVDSARCTACHQAVAPRAKHRGFTCDRCHREHAGDDPKGALFATATCSDKGCHDTQHAADFAALAATAPDRVQAGTLRPRTPDLAAFHAQHARVGAPASRCYECHADTSRGHLEPTRRPGLTCMRCHTAPADAAVACERCHAGEHGHKATDEALPIVIVEPPPTTGRSLRWGFLLALLPVLPALGLAIAIRRRRRPVPPQPDSAEYVKKKLHSINVAKCVGCSRCVDVCPTKVLDLTHHKAVVTNFDACIQCSRCEEACAFDALRMYEADGKPPMVEVPQLDPFYESMVKGLYLIGQASGTPQIKNAVNLGRAVVQRIAQAGYHAGSGGAGRVDVAIVGGGPAGLSAALTCLEVGLSYVLLEKEREPVWTIRTYYHKGKLVMAEPKDVELESSVPHRDWNREELLGDWAKLIAECGVEIQTGRAVTNVQPDGAGFRVELDGLPAVLASKVVVAVGSIASPRPLGCPGDDLPKVRPALADPDEWKGKNVLVVGPGDAAIEVVTALAGVAKVWHTMRGPQYNRPKVLNQKAIEALIAAGKVTALHAMTVQEVTAAAVKLAPKAGGQTIEIPNDVVFTLIGGEPLKPWLEKLGIAHTNKEHAWSPPPTDELARKTAVGVTIRRIARKR